jgi:hypothetical protein
MIGRMIRGTGEVRMKRANKSYLFLTNFILTTESAEKNTE